MKTYGPYTRKDGRQHVVHFDGKIRTTESYPRYLWKRRYGHIPEGYEVDHKDGNISNNDITNFQLLPKSDNIRKSIKHANELTLVCICCGKAFTRSERQERNNRKQGKIGPYCSKKCVGKTYH